ncbi:LRR receptor-like serine threonine-protein kinase [Seminavis robusta]|uniref:LRR receptor-like serine threonine-protein kinase n=1 Tax=Seminavis robusta TaxID=568900 RepID=A0A9N8HU78_9STRA|nr:LRR receptor-like serine threonine-protein kinase [Seminavis robusta]|eukprot:Sro1770_g296550.1 LRR receptor-like serine threonine-protein kinase (526) ;mRNA; r:9092-10669
MESVAMYDPTMAKVKPESVKDGPEDLLAPAKKLNASMQTSTSTGRGAFLFGITALLLLPLIAIISSNRGTPSTTQPLSAVIVPVATHDPSLSMSNIQVAANTQASTHTQAASDANPKKKRKRKLNDNITTRPPALGPPASAPTTTQGTVELFGTRYNVATTSRIDQSFAGLTGTISTDIGLLTRLTSLNFHRNQISGTIPTETGMLTALTLLSVWENQLTESIPSQIGLLTDLNFLGLGDNQLSGTIPSEIGSLAEMVSLSVSINMLSGTVPSQIGLLTSLEYMWLDDNDLSGSVPRSLCANSELALIVADCPPDPYYVQCRCVECECYVPGSTPQPPPGTSPSTVTIFGSSYDVAVTSQIEISREDFLGTIPTEIGYLTELTRLSLPYNEISGSIPSEIGALTALTYLALYVNDLVGTIPSQVGLLTGLSHFNVEENRLSGSMPSEFGLLTALTYLGFNGNQLSGSIPGEVTSLTNLRSFFLDDNQFTGSVPSRLCGNSGLAVIRVDCTEPYDVACSCPDCSCD